MGNRKTIIAGNWKMNKTASDVKPFIESVKALVPENVGCGILVCAPFPLLPALAEYSSGTCISVGAQNVSEHSDGAYTGEVSVSMLRDIGTEYVIVGHSTRRKRYGETDDTVRLKVAAVLAGGLTPIICIGESEAQRQMEQMSEICAYQVKSALFGLTPEEISRCVIAYEPIWAIGTGLTASAEEAQDAVRKIRDVIRGLGGAEIAEGISILYGGSMNADNAAELLAMPDIDGGLVGGASLDAESFAKLAVIANSSF